MNSCKQSTSRFAKICSCDVHVCVYIAAPVAQHRHFAGWQLIRRRRRRLQVLASCADHLQQGPQQPCCISCVCVSVMCQQQTRPNKTCQTQSTTHEISSLLSPLRKSVVHHRKPDFVFKSAQNNTTSHCSQALGPTSEAITAEGSPSSSSMERGPVTVP